MEKNVVSFVFKMTTKTQRGHYYMIKIYVMDTNVLIQSPNALFSFEDNLVVLPMVVLEELDHLKKADGETGANARKCIRLLEELRQKGNLLEGVSLENGGICWVEKNFVDVELPVDLSLEVADNRILKVCLGLKKSRKEQVVLVTKDILLRIKAQVLDLCAEDFISEQVIAHDRQYTGRCEVYAPDELFKDFKKKGIPVDEVYQLDENEKAFCPNLLENQFVIIKSDQARKKTHLGRVEHGILRKLEFKKSSPYGISPRNAGQYFLQEALMQPAEKAPLVIVKGMAGTSKTFYSLAVGLEKLMNHPTGEYRKILVCKVIEALCEAAENGKEVVVLVELRARFDEENNIRWSRMLEEAGCQIIYGLEHYKVHSKLCLITRRGENGIQYITQIGTGNYNEKTARLYTDLSLMTANEQIGMDAARVFQALAKGEVVEDMEHLLVAPKCLQSKVIEKIEEQIQKQKNGETAYIGLKMNSLTDKRIIDKLIDASKAGVKIDMIVRGICCLIPGVEGETENIHVISVVGRFLEHSRIYIFGNGEEAQYYIGSADFMTRNTVKRVEVAAPVYSERLKKRLQDLFDLMLSDNKKARKEDAKGTYSVVECKRQPINSQELLYQEAYAKAAVNSSNQLEAAVQQTENKVIE